jgi:hypothetical protein
MGEERDGVNAVDVLGAMLEAVTDWLRGPVTDTASRWEALTVAALSLALLITAGWLLILLADWQRIRHRRENGGNRLTARAMARAAILRVLDTALLWLCFVALALNASHTIVILAFAVPALAVLKVVDGTLDWLARRGLRRYYLLQEARARRAAHQEAWAPGVLPSAPSWNPHGVPDIREHRAPPGAEGAEKEKRA